MDICNHADSLEESERKEEERKWGARFSRPVREGRRERERRQVQSQEEEPKGGEKVKRQVSNLRIPEVNYTFSVARGEERTAGEKDCCAFFRRKSSAVRCRVPRSWDKIFMKTHAVVWNADNRCIISGREESEFTIESLERLSKCQWKGRDSPVRDLCWWWKWWWRYVDDGRRVQGLDYEFFRLLNM